MEDTDRARRGTKEENDMSLEDIRTDVWKISEFTQKIIESLSRKFPDESVSIHYNTVDKWFKELEERGIHYVNRASGEKIYDSLDLKIAEFIYLRRKQKFAKDIIYTILPKHVELRPFPHDYGEELLPANLRQVMSTMMKSVKEEVATEVEQKLRKEYEVQTKAFIKQLLIEDRKRLDDPEYFEKQFKKREADFTKAVVQRQIEIQEALEREALEKWKELPWEERTIKRHLFAKREEDVHKKEAFINQYIRENMIKKIEEWKN
jgi:DNA-binding transcriptional regulator YhcF (GntR family)